MTLPKLTSTTAELIAYRDELVNDLSTRNKEIARLTAQSHHVYRLIEEVLDILNQRESCPHEDFTENLEGRKCRTCGLETK